MVEKDVGKAKATTDRIMNAVARWVLTAAAAFALAALGYSVKTSWQNANRIEQISEGMKGIKRALIEISTKTNPGDPTVSLDLLSNAAVKKGLSQFQSAKYSDAYKTWADAAAKGDGEAVLAIFSANAALKSKSTDPAVSASTRDRAAVALRQAPQVKEINGKYELKEKAEPQGSGSH